jgi:hypothetical protein
LPYIYRISKDGKRVKKLAMGDNYFIKGDRIYYTKYKVAHYEFDSSWEYGEVVGNASMKLNGTNKRSEASNTFKIKAIETYTSSISYKVVSGNYTYYLDGEFLESKKLIRENNKTGKTKVIYEVTGRKSIRWVNVIGNSLLVHVTGGTGKDKLVYMNNNGKNRKTLISAYAVGR